MGLEEEKWIKRNLLPPEVSCQESERQRGISNFLEVTGTVAQ
jgi:hypothetical protein